MRSSVIAVALALGVFALPLPAYAAKGCGLFTADAAAVHAKVIRGTTNCATARRVLRRYLTSSAACSGSACVRFAARRACATAAYRDFPRLRELQSRPHRRSGLLNGGLAVASSR